MFGRPRSPTATYAQVSIESDTQTADPHRLIVMLLDGALSSIAIGRAHMENNEIPEKGASISRAIDIIDNGLLASLDIEVGGDLAKSLASLYEYMVTRLLQANLHNNSAALSEVAGLLEEIRSAWVAIDPKAGTS